MNLRRLTFRVGNDAVPVGLGVLNDPGRLTARAWDQVLRILVGLEHVAIAVVARLLRIVDRILYGLRVIEVLEVESR